MPRLGLGESASPGYHDTYRNMNNRKLMDKQANTYVHIYICIYTHSHLFCLKACYSKLSGILDLPTEMTANIQHQAAKLLYKSPKCRDLTSEADSDSAATSLEDRVIPVPSKPRAHCVFAHCCYRLLS